MNKNIISNFVKLIKQTEEECYDLKEEGKKKEATVCQFKVRNYKKGLESLKEFKEEIKSSEDVKGISGIGKGIMTRIDEILESGKLAELKTSSKSKSSDKLEQLNQLQLITGIGPKKAHVLYEEGYTLSKLLEEINKATDGKPNMYTIEEIMELSEEKDLYLHQLTHHQIVGLKYFNDINERIPRSEVEKIEIKLKKHIAKIDNKLMVTVCGSYRRGRPNSGDVDVLITHPDLATQDDIDDEGQDYLIDVIRKLTKSGLLVDHLTNLGTTKYMGVCRLTSKSKGRRIDIRFVARDDYAPALLYFTGSKTFNQVMRGEALKQGYTINEYGIYKLQKKNGKYIHKKGKKVTVQTEEDIFDLVGMEYLEPHQRESV
jgi:DNA polymerase beta